MMWGVKKYQYFFPKMYGWRHNGAIFTYDLKFLMYFSNFNIFKMGFCDQKHYKTYCSLFLSRIIPKNLNKCVKILRNICENMIIF